MKGRKITDDVRQYDPLFGKIIDELDSLGKEHYGAESQRFNTTEREQAVMNDVNALLAQGYTEVLVLKALLTCTNNWGTFEIARLTMFQHMLLEAIDAGALEPDNHFAWDIMEIAALNNDPELFMTDMERYYDLLATAAEEGNAIALDIMNTIWEPENIIEED